MFVVGKERPVECDTCKRIIKLMNDIVDFVRRRVPRLRAGVVRSTSVNDDAISVLATQVKRAVDQLIDKKDNAIQWLVVVLPNGTHNLSAAVDTLSMYKYHTKMVVTFVDLDKYSNPTKDEILCLEEEYTGRLLKSSLHDNDNNIVEFTSVLREFCKGMKFLQCFVKRTYQVT